MFRRLKVIFSAISLYIDPNRVWVHRENQRPKNWTLWYTRDRTSNKNTVNGHSLEELFQIWLRNHLITLPDKPSMMSVCFYTKAILWHFALKRRHKKPLLTILGWVRFHWNISISRTVFAQQLPLWRISFNSYEDEDEQKFRPYRGLSAVCKGMHANSAQLVTVSSLPQCPTCHSVELVTLHSFSQCPSYHSIHLVTVHRLSQWKPYHNGNLATVHSLS